MKPTRTLFMLFLLLMSHHAVAQTSSSCSSDGQPTPTALFERFINADCETCWRDPSTPIAAPGTLALDWIVPGTLGEDAPLAAATSRPPVVLAHGQKDLIVPVAAHHVTKAALERVGVQVTAHISPETAHSVDPAGLALAARAMHRLFSH